MPFRLKTTEFYDEIAMLDIHSWQRMTDVQRTGLIIQAKALKVISNHEAYLLDWLPKSQPTIVEEQYFVKLIKTIKERALSISDTLPPPSVPESDKPVGPEENHKDAEVEEVPNTMRSYIIPPGLYSDRDQFDLVGEDDMIERFNDLGIDIEKELDNWFSFYWRSLYGHNKYGQKYNLELPAMTFEAMYAFELAWEKGEIDTVMIDDPRVPDGTTLRTFQKGTSRKNGRIYNTGRPMEPEFMEQFLKGNLVNFGYRPHNALTTSELASLKNLYKTADTDRDVRIIGIKTGMHDGVTPKPSFTEAAERLANPYTNIMELGTWIRFLHYLKYSRTNWYDAYIENLAQSLAGNTQSIPRVLLNTFTATGHYTTATAHRGRVSHHTEPSTSTEPTLLDQTTIPLIVVQSDCHPPDDDIPF